jgi:hypothetical protein
VNRRLASSSSSLNGTESDTFSSFQVFRAALATTMMLRFVQTVAFLWSWSTASSFGVAPGKAFVRGGQQRPLSAAVISDLVTEENLQVLSERGRRSLLNLVENDTDGSQSHVYGSWPAAGVDDEGKKRLAEQVGTCSYCSCCVILHESHQPNQPNNFCLSQSSFISWLTWTNPIQEA